MMTTAWKVKVCGDDDVGGVSESVSVRKCAHVEKWGVVGEVRPFGSKLEQLNIRNTYQSQKYIVYNTYKYIQYQKYISNVKVRNRFQHPKV